MGMIFVHMLISMQTETHRVCRGQTMVHAVFRNGKARPRPRSIFIMHEQVLVPFLHLS